MQPRRSIARLALSVAFAALGFAAFANSPAQADEPGLVRVAVDSGRSFEGKIDAATDDRALALRSGSDRAWIRRTIEWNRVTGGEYAGREITAAELKALAERLKSSPAEAPAPPASAVEAPAATPSTSEAYVVLPTPIAAVTFDAALANWDGDVEADGLIVQLMPIDANGFYAATRGTVEIELFAKQPRTFHHAPQSGGRSVDLISRWTCTVTPDDFGPNGAILKFPFAAVHPEFSPAVGGYGLVHVRLSVAGSGVFEDSQDGVRIRPFTPVRDALQHTTGARFLPSERTGR